MSRASEIQSVHTAYTSGDFLTLETLRMMLDPETFNEGMALVFATHELEMEDRNRHVDSLVYLAEHAPGMSIHDGIASLSPPEFADYVRIRHGEEPA